VISTMLDLYKSSSIRISRRARSAGASATTDTDAAAEAAEPVVTPVQDVNNHPAAATNGNTKKIDLVEMRVRLIRMLRRTS